jgi:membrane protein DedA with SNARE-associated domain/membrane-associated phospholipid phosphatase
MIEKLFGLIELLGHWTYLIIFLAAFLESAAFMGFIVPGETIVILSGFLASQGYLKLGNCIPLIAIGAVLGDAAGYFLGRVVGRGYFERHKRLLFLKEKHIRKAEEYFRKHGGKTVFIGRFIGFLRAMGPFAAGVSKMRYRSFFIYDVAGGTIWAAAFTLLGYFFGESWQLVEKWSGRAGLFFTFVVLVIAGFSYLYKKYTKRQEEVYGWFRDRYTEVLSLAYVRGFIARHPRLVAFVRDRLSPGSYLGLHLTIGFILSAIFVWIFGGITEDVLTGDPLVKVDQWVMQNVLHFRAPIVTKIMVVFTHVAGGIVITAGSLFIMIYFLFKKRFDYLTAYISAILGGSILVLVLKVAIRRRRPAAETSVVGAGGWSFPSGHAMMSVIFYGMVLYFAVRHMRSWELRVFMVMAAGFVVFLLGLSRIYLEVHYLSDVLAGYAGGLFWLTVCITALEVYRKKTAR